MTMAMKWGTTQEEFDMMQIISEGEGIMLAFIISVEVLSFKFWQITLLTRGICRSCGGQTNAPQQSSIWITACRLGRILTAHVRYF